MIGSEEKVGAPWHLNIDEQNPSICCYWLHVKYTMMKGQAVIDPDGNWLAIHNSRSHGLHQSMLDKRALITSIYPAFQRTVMYLQTQITAVLSTNQYDAIFDFTNCYRNANTTLATVISAINDGYPKGAAKEMERFEAMMQRSLTRVPPRGIARTRLWTANEPRTDGELATLTARL